MPGSASQSHSHTVVLMRIKWRPIHIWNLIIDDVMSKCKVGIGYVMYSIPCKRRMGGSHVSGTARGIICIMFAACQWSTSSHMWIIEGYSLSVVYYTYTRATIYVHNRSNTKKVMYYSLWHTSPMFNETCSMASWCLWFRWQFNLKWLLLVSSHSNVEYTLENSLYHTLDNRVFGQHFIESQPVY